MKLKNGKQKIIFNKMNQHLKTYYQKRAKEYDRVYQKPERQADLKQLHQYLKTTFDNKTVLEIACGTGYWTKTIAQTCTSIIATDINEAVLEIARKKNYNGASVTFKALDLWQLAIPPKPYDSLFGGFIWSHILTTDLPRFLALLKSQLTKNGALIFIDNKYVKGSNTPIARTDDAGNTYQIRRLQNGTAYEVLKNFPSKEEIEDLIADLGFDMEWMELEYYWVLKLKRLI